MNDAQQHQVNIPNREVISQLQMQNLLSAINTITSCLAHTAPHEEGNDAPRYVEAAIAAENSLINTCERLDKILAEDDRWSITGLKVLEEKLGALYDANRRLLEVRSAVEQQTQCPHMKYKPTLMRMGDGWAAIYGSPDFLDKSLVGYGDTPEKAFKCFDLLFDGTVSTDLVQWITSQHEKTNVDGVRDPNATDAQIIREDDGGNSEVPPEDGFGQ
jgi:hypothetical protein